MGCLFVHTAGWHSGEQEWTQEVFTFTRVGGGILCNRESYTGFLFQNHFLTGSQLKFFIGCKTNNENIPKFRKNLHYLFFQKALVLLKVAHLLYGAVFSVFDLLPHSLEIIGTFCVKHNVVLSYSGGSRITHEKEYDTLYFPNFSLKT